MDFKKTDDTVYPYGYVKLLKATYEEQIEDIINVPTEGQILMRESTYTFPITENTYESWKKIERLYFFEKFLKHMNYTVTFKLIMLNNKETYSYLHKAFCAQRSFRRRLRTDRTLLE